jgi:hypothetical protein
MMKLGHGPLCAQHLRCTGRVQAGPENFAHSAHSIDVGPCAMPPARSALAVDLKQTVSHGSQMNKNSALVHSGQPYPPFSPSPSQPLCHTEQPDLLAGERPSRGGENGAHDAIRSPSLVCAPTVGWMHHRRVASQRRLSLPTRTDEVVSVVCLEFSSSSVCLQAAAGQGLVPEHTPVGGGLRFNRGASPFEQR